MKGRLCITFLALGLVASVAVAQDNPEYTVNFVANPPTIDGVVSAGEWDAASPVITGLVAHNGDTPEGEATSVRVLYGLEGLYIVYECVDTDVFCDLTGSEVLQSGPTDATGRATAGEVGWDFAGTDYLAVYLDPGNSAAGRIAYSIQAQPSNSFFGEVDANGNSYSYTEAGQFGNAKFRINDPAALGGDLVFWVGGGSWDLTDSKILDARTSDGFVMEWCIAWGDLDTAFAHYGSEIIDGAVLVNVEAEFEETVWGLATDDQRKNMLTGMPLPGTVWDAQFARHNDNDPASTYSDWTGVNSGFVSRPFGRLIFGTASGSDIAEAMLHQ